MNAARASSLKSAGVFRTFTARALFSVACRAR